MAGQRRAREIKDGTRRGTCKCKCVWVCVGVWGGGGGGGGGGGHCAPLALSPGPGANTKNVTPERAAVLLPGVFVMRPAAPQPTSPPITTSPPKTACEDMSVLMEWGATAAVMGNSTGAVLTMRTTLPDPGVSRMPKKGRSRPSSV